MALISGLGRLGSVNEVCSKVYTLAAVGGALISFVGPRQIFSIKDRYLTTIMVD